MKKLIKVVLIVFACMFGLYACAEIFLEDEDEYEYSEIYDTWENNTNGSNNGSNNSLGSNSNAGGSNASGSNSNASNSDPSNVKEVGNLEDYFDTSVIREKGVKLKGNGEDTVTIFVYMNGSDLESDDQEATTDLTEMIAGGTSDKVNCLIQTMGTKKWSSKYGIASNHTQRYKLVDGGLKLVDDSLKQLDCTKPATLTDFIKWGVTNYPADRYILQFWNHGGGPVYGFGYDEWQSADEGMSVAQMRKALTDAGVYFDFIGMDCCIMSCLETTMALYDFCDYMILSEEFESGLGWSYEGWMKAINKNSSIDTVSLAKIAIDDNVEANENDYSAGDNACMSLIDESVMKLLYTAWVDFAYAHEEDLLGENYSQQVKKSRRARPMGYGFGEEGFFSNFDSNYQLSDYYITDIMAVAQNINSKESNALSAALSNAIVYNRTTSGDKYMTGLSVTLPYGDRDFYGLLKEVFTECGIDSNYIAWLEKFVTAEGSSQFYDYDSEWNDWYGWGEYENDYDWNDWDYYGDDEYWCDDGWDWLFGPGGDDEIYWYDAPAWYDGPGRDFGPEWGDGPGCNGGPGCDGGPGWDGHGSDSWW